MKPQGPAHHSADSAARSQGFVPSTARRFLAGRPGGLPPNSVRRARILLGCAGASLLAGCSSLPSPDTRLLPQADMTLSVSVYSPRRNRIEQVPIDVYKPTVAHTSKPGVVYMSGCGGVTYPTTQAILEQLRQRGVTVAILQSMRVEGRPSNFCVTPHVTGAARAEEVFHARAAMVAAGLVNEDNVALIGSSHGGWAISYAMYGEDQSGKFRNATPFRAAVAIYPYCQNLDTASDVIRTPTLMLLGGKDDWTPPYRCEYLAKRSQRQERLTLHTFPGATHGWDIDFPPRTVPTGTSKGTAFLYYSPGATVETQTMTLNFLVREMQLPKLAIR